jgi:hypothetical protein
MNRWAGIAIVGIWIGIGLLSFNIGPAITTIAEYGAATSVVIATLDILFG